MTNANENVNDAALRIGLLAIAEARKTLIFGEEINQIAAPVAKSVCSAEKGLSGEAFVRDILSKNYLCEKPGYKSCDLQVRDNNLRVLVEVKDYSRPVPRAETLKFLRDIEINSPNGAVFVSLGSPIAGINSICSLQWEIFGGRRTPIFYLQSRSPESILLATKTTLDCAREDAATYTTRELIDFEKLQGGLDQIAAARQSMQIKVGEFVSNFASAYAAVVSGEQTMRKTINEIDTTTAAQTTLPFALLAKCTDYPRLDEENKIVLQSVLTAAGTKTWKGSKKKIQCEDFSINVARVPTISIPRLQVSPEWILAAVSSGEQFSADCSTVEAQISKKNEDLLLQFVRGESTKV